MSAYETELKNEKKFRGNVIIRFRGIYFSIHTPDSGLTIEPAYRGLIQSLVINPTTIDLRRVSTSIASYSFTLVDRNLALSRLIGLDAAQVLTEEVEIWVGRVGVGMAFADYYKLPNTKIKGVSRPANAYSFRTAEETDRMNRGTYTKKVLLAGNILPTTTVLTAKSDISAFPASGYLKLGNEFVSYGVLDTVSKQFQNVVRGEFGTTPAALNINAEITLAERVVGNPITTLLQILISGGGGGGYDVLDSGLGISPSLIDVAGIEALRDSDFPSLVFDFKLYGIANTLTFIEDEILAPCNLRFTRTRTAKLTLVRLDRPYFIEDLDVIDEDTLTQQPNWTVDEDKIVNQISVSWDYDDAQQEFRRKQLFQDAASIAAFGAKKELPFEFKAVRDLFGGEAFTENFAENLFYRLANPLPEISVRTQIDKSLLSIGDQSRLESQGIPNEDGALNFATEMEVVNQAINYQNGDVSMRLAFTSFSDIRSCFIAPSDQIAVVTDQQTVEVGAGRGDLWKVGFKVVLWDTINLVYLPDAPNEITEINGDEIVFADNFATALTTDYMLKFPDFDKAAASQKRYCFVGVTGETFPDGSKPYSIVP